MKNLSIYLDKLINDLLQFKSCKVKIIGSRIIELYDINDLDKLLGSVTVIKHDYYLYTSDNLFNVRYETQRDLLQSISNNLGEPIPVIEKQFEVEDNRSVTELINHFESDYSETSCYTKLVPSEFNYRGFRVRIIAVKVIDLHRFRVEFRDMLYDVGIEYKRFFLYEDEAYNMFLELASILYQFNRKAAIDFVINNNFESNTAYNSDVDSNESNTETDNYYYQI